VLVFKSFKCSASITISNEGIFDSDEVLNGSLGIGRQILCWRDESKGIELAENRLGLDDCHAVIDGFDEGIRLLNDGVRIDWGGLDGSIKRVDLGVDTGEDALESGDITLHESGGSVHKGGNGKGAEGEQSNNREELHLETTSVVKLGCRRAVVISSR
jgi:hypothetical protein